MVTKRCDDRHFARTWVGAMAWWFCVDYEKRSRGDAEIAEV
jgi:hypothetical protein